MRSQWLSGSFLLNPMNEIAIEGEFWRELYYRFTGGYLRRRERWKGRGGERGLLRHQDGVPGNRVPSSCWSGALKGFLAETGIRHGEEG